MPLLWSAAERRRRPQAADRAVMSDLSGPLVEAVPNFSEGRDRRVIDAIATALDGQGARVLHVDANPDANRTVVTLAGPLSAVTDALFRGVHVAIKRIDMRSQQGAHIRIGAADVVPLVLLDPSEQAERACLAAVQSLAERLASDLNLPIFLYEDSARRTPFRSLPRCRRGGYEALASRFQDPEDGPDLGPSLFTEQTAASGATVVGLRPLLVAMNFTLDSDDADLAARIALAIRSNGAAGRPHRLPYLRAIGWKMNGYGGRAQVSVNLLRIDVCSVLDAFEAVRALSPVAVLGSELIGLAPARVFRDAGLAARGKHCSGGGDDGILSPAAAADEALLFEGAEYLGLGHLDAWRPREELSARILELRLRSVGMLPERFH